GRRARRRALRAQGLAHDQPRPAGRARRRGARRAEPLRVPRGRLPRARPAVQRAAAHRAQAAPARPGGGPRVDPRLSMKPITDKKVRVLEGLEPGRIPWSELLEAGEPVLLRGVVSGWELVAAGRRSAAAAIDYLLSF